MAIAAMEHHVDVLIIGAGPGESCNYLDQLVCMAECCFDSWSDAGNTAIEAETECKDRR